MKFMKLGIRPDTFHTEEATRTVISDVASDLIIQINNISYLLHKYQLVSKSGLLQNLCSSDSENVRLELHDTPGGEEAFEVCAKFCYGITINLSAHNIVPSLCAAKFLLMTETVHKGNLALKLETFFSSCVLQGWKDSILALHTTSKVPEWSENLGIIRRCIDSIVDKILTPPPKVIWSYTYTRQCYTQKNRRFVPKDWWTEDVSDLDIDIFRYIISAVGSTKILQHRLIGEALHVYTCRWLPENSTKSQEAHGSSSSASQSESKDTKRRVIETIVSMIPAEKESVSLRFLLRLLRLAYVVGTSLVTKSELVRRSSEKLEEATVNDLLLLYIHDDTRYIYDLDLVEAVLESFVMQWRRRQQQHVGAGQPSLRLIRKIGRLVDSYLQVVATDINIPVAKLVSLAKAVPEIARTDHDDLYRAIHIYLVEHQEMGKAEKRQLCSVLDPPKLSRQVRRHAVRNEKLPLRIVVQLLFFEWDDMKDTKPSTSAPPQTYFDHDQRITSHEVEEIADIIKTRHKTTKMPERQEVITQAGSSRATLNKTKEKYARNTR